MENVNIEKALKDKGFSKEEIKTIIRDYEIYVNGIDLIAKNTGLQYEDVERVLGWLDCFNDIDIYDNYASINGIYDRYILLNNGYAIFYNKEIPQF